MFCVATCAISSFASRDDRHIIKPQSFNSLLPYEIPSSLRISSAPTRISSTTSRHLRSPGVRCSDMRGYLELKLPLVPKYLRTNDSFSAETLDRFLFWRVSLFQRLSRKSTLLITAAVSPLHWSATVSSLCDRPSERQAVQYAHAGGSTLVAEVRCRSLGWCEGACRRSVEKFYFSLIYTDLICK